LRISIFFLALIFSFGLSIDVFAQVELVDDIGDPGGLGVLGVFEINGNIVTYGYNAQEDYEFRVYEHGTDEPRVIGLPSVLNNAYVTVKASNSATILAQAENSLAITCGNLDSLHAFLLGYPFGHGYAEMHHAEFNSNDGLAYVLYSNSEWNYALEYGILAIDPVSLDTTKILDLLQYHPHNSIDFKIEHFSIINDHVVFFNRYEASDLHGEVMCYSLDLHTRELVNLSNAFGQQFPIDNTFHKYRVLDGLLYMQNDFTGVVVTDGTLAGTHQLYENNFNVGFRDQEELPVVENSFIFQTRVDGNWSRRGLFQYTPSTNHTEFLFEVPHEKTMITRCEPLYINGEYFLFIVYFDWSFDLRKITPLGLSAPLWTSDSFSEELRLVNCFSGKKLMYFGFHTRDGWNPQYWVSDARGIHASLFPAHSICYVDDLNEYLQGDTLYTEFCIENSRDLYRIVESEIDLRDPEIMKVDFYPNPIIDLANIKWQSGLTLDLVRVYDTMGRALKTTAVNLTSGYFQFDFSDLPRGVYILECIGDDNNWIKFIKE
jgi:Secretion system C-terminal sorting domain